MSQRILVTPRSLTRTGHPALQRLAQAGYELILSSPGEQPDEDELQRSRQIYAKLGGLPSPPCPAQAQDGRDKDDHLGYYRAVQTKYPKKPAHVQSRLSKQDMRRSDPL